MILMCVPKRRLHPSTSDLQDGTQWVPTVGGHFLHSSLEFTGPAGQLEVIVETDDGTSIKKQRRIAFAKK